VFSENAMVEATKQVAAILKLPVTDDLARVVADYLARPGLSLLGEADAAMEWIADPARNRKRQSMTPAFFRRWLKREVETAERGYGAPVPPTAGRARAVPVQARIAANGAGPPGTPTQEAENPYHAFVRQRAQEVLRHFETSEEASHETSS
jgi:hypothetical protein